MKFAALFVVFALLVVAASAVSIKPIEESLARDVYTAWKKVHQKAYTTLAEEEHRFQIFRDNLHIVHSHNSQSNVSYKLKMNHFGDLTIEEFKALHLGMPKRSARAPFTIGVHKISGAAPATQDWRKEGAVTAVKNQAQCGSCWSFSTTGSLEGNRVSQKKLALVSLSEQELVDCSGPQGNQGCNGGLMDQAFSYVKANGLTSEALYGYTAADGKCRSPLPERVIPASPADGSVSGFVDVTPNNDQALMDALGTVGPVSVAINAATSHFQFYSSGVFDYKSCPSSSDDLDHGVLAIGYNSDSGKEYYIVKNSWGASWGNEGYIWMARGEKVNMCGILDDASYPKFQ